MRKVWVLIIAALLLAAVAAGVWFWWAQPALEARAEAEARAAREAEAETAQAAAYDRFAKLVNNMDELAAQPALTVTEAGEPVGSYSLARLGLKASVQEQLCTQFNEMEQMIPTVFAALPYEEKIAAHCEVKSPSATVFVDALTLDAVLADLEAVERSPSADACAVLERGGYRSVPEHYGTELCVEAVTAALTEAVAAVTVDMDRVHGVTFELTDCDCYTRPEMTLATADFDFAALLAEDLAGVVLTLDFQDAAETLNAVDYVSVDAAGMLCIDNAALAAQTEVWAAQYDRRSVPYLLDTYMEGPVEMPFLTVDYLMDTGALTAQLQDWLLHPQSTVRTVPFICLRDGQPFSMGENYVEVDITNQVMTYFKDGGVFVTTDIVTGADWRSPTPEGLYKVENMTTDAWLYGEDYTVFVDYWVGFIGFWYGLHDANWRTEFGGDNYLLNGSHGCVNTPAEAMAKIYENIELGTPVIVHGPYREWQ